MAHERVGDRTDDAHGSGAKTRIQLILQVNDIGRTIAGRLVVHSMVGGDGNRGAQRDQLVDARVHGVVVSIRLWLSGRVLVLHIIRGREVQEVGSKGG